MFTKVVKEGLRFTTGVLNTLKVKLRRGQYYYLRLRSKRITPRDARTEVVREKDQRFVFKMVLEKVQLSVVRKRVRLYDKGSLLSNNVNFYTRFLYVRIYGQFGVDGRGTSST